MRIIQKIEMEDFRSISSCNLNVESDFVPIIGTTVGSQIYCELLTSFLTGKLSLGGW
jgi:hypothetical protein